MNIIASFVLACATSGQDPPALQYGPWVHYLFQPVVTVRAGTDACTVDVIFPRPHEDESQRIVRWIGPPTTNRQRLLHDIGRTNEFLKVKSALESKDVVTIGYTAVVAVRSITLLLAVDREPPVEELGFAKQKRLSRYLRHTESTGKGREDIARQAQQITADVAGPLSRARRIYEEVLSRVAYKREFSFKGASRCWDEAIGECCDYAALFVCMCRSVGIPARPIAGFAFHRGQWSLHVWAEFYTSGIGWIPCDPSLDDIGNTSKRRYFGSVDDRRLALVRGFDLSLAPVYPGKVPILQEYLVRYQGPTPPTISFRVAGERFGDSLPAEYRPKSAVPPTRLLPPRN